MAPVHETRVAQRPGLLVVLCTAAQVCLSVQSAFAMGTGLPLAITHYDAYLEPELAGQTVRGTVRVTLSRRGRDGETLAMDRGDLTIESVDGGGVPLRFSTPAQHVVIRIADERAHPRAITIRYRGAPKSGLLFFPDRRLIYTLFATSQWMVSLDAPSERATFRLRLVVPRGWTVVASGREVKRRRLSDRAEISEWRLERAVPSYTFGFVAGELSSATGRAGRLGLRYVGRGLSIVETQRLFGETGRMLAFFSRHAGTPYPGHRYAQVVVPRTSGQEMAGFSVVSEDYARAVLSDPLNESLLAHELAHQWWGNMVTCRDWTEFWLNEGFATFFAAAYREERFGREVYLKDIEAMRTRYERVRDAGHDRSLIFPDWNRPSADDRTLVYQKGGFVLHRLREFLGDDTFWAGLRRYTTHHFGQSVTTADFQRAMEEASRRDLRPFFAEWVYLSR